MASVSSSYFYPLGETAGTRIYSVCYFGAEDIAVELIDALDDQDAVHIARKRRPSMTREIWDRHRFVARINGGSA